MAKPLIENHIIQIIDHSELQNPSKNLLWQDNDRIYAADIYKFEASGCNDCNNNDLNEIGLNNLKFYICYDSNC